jgi:hypothetical protein
VQFVCALFCVAAVIWFLQYAWLPALLEAVHQLPPEGEIRAGNLHWRADSPQRLAQEPFLAVTVDLQNEGQAHSPAHVEVVFCQKHFKIFSLFGFLQGDYPQGWRVAFNRIELEAWWGAWKLAIAIILTGLLLIGFLLVWSCLATIYCLPVRLAGFLKNRDLSLAGSWRLAGAALMPGALFLAGTIVCYGLGGVDLIRLVLGVIVHLVLGWVYLISGVLALGRNPEIIGLKENPFVSESK